MAVASEGCGPALCCRHRPEQTALYQVVHQHLETYLALAVEEDWAGQRVPSYVEREFRRYLAWLPKPQRNGTTALTLTPLELIDQLAALIPPPRCHRHRYHGVLAPNAPLRTAATAYARDAADDPSARDEIATHASAQCRTLALRRATSGPYCWAGCSSRCPWSVPTAALTCASSPSSLTPRPSSRSSPTSVSHHVHPRSHPHAPALRHPAPLGYQPKSSWFGRSLLQRSSPTRLGRCAGADAGPGPSQPARARLRV